MTMHAVCAMAPRIEEALRLLVAAVEASISAGGGTGDVYRLAGRARAVLDEVDRG